MGGPLVLKLGGSLYETGRLAGVLDLVFRAGTPLVIVPGGGPFADAVRAEHAAGRISDAAAHQLAVLAMQQMALVIADMQPGIVPVETIEEIEAALKFRRIAVWLPDRIVRAASDIERSWRMTSDGLSAWLAIALGGRARGARVMLVKSCAIPTGDSPAALAGSGIVDEKFAEVVVGSGLEWRVISADEWQALRDALQASPEA